MQNGCVQHYQLQSDCLDERRGISVFFPPGIARRANYPILYCADGQLVPRFARRLNLAMKQRAVAPVVLVGVHSSTQHRSREYIDGANEQIFLAHERFFTDEVQRWAAAELSVSSPRASCGVFGVSNGGAFALSIAARHPETYGVVIAFSVAGGPDRVPPSAYCQQPNARYYLAAGTREKPFCRTVRAVANQLKKHGIDVACSERSAAGHKFSFWDSELVEALQWAFPKRRAN